MIMFFDVMLIDDDAVLNQPYVCRRQRLRDLVHAIPGRADLAMVQEINFSSSKAPEQLLQALAVAFTQRWEGYVMKPCDDPYVNFHDFELNTYCSCWFKLKRDYIKGLGDTAELAIVGAGYDAKEAKRLGVAGLKWTYFHIGCLRNKDDVVRRGAKPNFIVLDAFNQSITKSDFTKLCQLGQFVAEKTASPVAKDTFDFSICSGLPCKMDTIFKKPFVFEVMGSGFDKPPNQDHFLLRFPRVVKILWDRKFIHAVSFDELQNLAAEARATPEGDLSADVFDWLERIKNSEPAKGSVLSWKDLQDNDSGSESVLTASPHNSPKRVKASQTALFVRTDTEELLPTERRLQSGEATSSPSSSHSATPDASEGTLPTPPGSSPKATRNVADKEPPRLPRSSQLPSVAKRSADVEDFENNPRASKKRCLERPSGSIVNRLDGSSNPAKDPHYKERTNALTEITNSARQHRADTRPETRTTNIKGALPRLDLVRKMTLGTEVKPYMKKREKPRPLSSSVRQTTASEDSTSPPSSSPFSARGLNSTMPLCPPVQTTVTLCRSLAVPNFSHCITVLSPCISKIPYLTEDLLPPFDGTVVAPGDTSSLIAPGNQYRQIVLLVESKRSKQTAQYLRSLYPVIQQCRRDMEIWDWRVLELKPHNVESGKNKKKCFIGRMRMTGVTEATVEWASGPASVIDNG